MRMDPTLVKDERPPRRITRLSSSTPLSKCVTRKPSTNNLKSLSLSDFVFGDELITLDELVKMFPGRRAQIQQLISLLGPLNSPMVPIFVYGGASMGKTSTLLQIFRHLNRPFVYCSCVTCYSPKLLFESILNQLLLHRKSESNSYSSAKRCERPSDFINLLREALTTFLDSLKGNMSKASSKKSSARVSGKMVYFVFDNFELVRGWDKSSTILLPLLFNLCEILKMSEVGVIFISKATPDVFPSDTGYVDPFPVYFPAYTEDELRKIFMKNQSNSKLYSYFLDVVLGPFCRITRRVDELSTAFSSLFKKYCEPLDDLGVALNEDVKRKLFGHIQPFIPIALSETFSIPSQSLVKDCGTKGKSNRKRAANNLDISDFSDELEFHMSNSAKYLLISAFLASRNPATLDASLFDSKGGDESRKKKRKTSQKSMGQKESIKETKKQETLMKGPGSFPLERLLAIFQCITCFDDYSPDGEELPDNSTSSDKGLMSDILLQLSSLCNANFITKGASCPLEGSIRYRSTVSEEMALKVARSLKFPLSKYMYRG